MALLWLLNFHKRGLFVGDALARLHTELAGSWLSACDITSQGAAEVSKFFSLFKVIKICSQKSVHVCTALCGGAPGPAGDFCSNDFL